MPLSREESFHLEEYKALRQELATTLKDRLDFNRWGLIGIAALYSYLITHPKPPVCSTLFLLSSGVLAFV
jgi:hypothetical protein